MASDAVTPLDLETMEFVADKPPLVGWELNEADGRVASFKTLRILGFKSGCRVYDYQVYACHSPTRGSSTCNPTP